MTSWQGKDRFLKLGNLSKPKFWKLEQRCIINKSFACQSIHLIPLSIWTLKPDQKQVWRGCRIVWIICYKYLNEILIFFLALCPAVATSSVFPKRRCTTTAATTRPKRRRKRMSTSNRRPTSPSTTLRLVDVDKKISYITASGRGNIFVF